MPLPGLSLVGFMDEPQAMDYLMTNCILPDTKSETLVKEWQDARQKLGRPIPKAGKPDTWGMHIKYEPYFKALINHPRMGDILLGMGSAEFKLVQIEPLLCFQPHISVQAAEKVYSSVKEAPTDTHPPSVETMLHKCLPQDLEEPEFQIYTDRPGHIATILSPTLNLQIRDVGKLPDDTARKVSQAGITFGTSAPFVQVVQFEGRCYLRNGYHRAYGLWKAKATYMPCLFLKATEFHQIGIPVGAFGQKLLTSGNPPTCGHFTQNRAHDVTLRVMRRLITVSWHQTVVPE